MKLADSPISFCVSCHSLYTGTETETDSDGNEVEKKKVRYIDFEAFYDGPVIANNAYAGGMHVQVTDLIICENCLISAGKLIGLVSAEDIIEENKELGILVEQKNEQIEDQQTIISDQSHTIQTLSKGTIKKPSRRPRIVEVT